MIYHVVTRNGKAKWIEPSLIRSDAVKAVKNLDGHYSYGLYTHGIKSFWTKAAAEAFISESLAERND